MNHVERREAIKNSARICVKCDGVGDVERWEDDEIVFHACDCEDGYVCDVEDATRDEIREVYWEARKERMISQVRRCRGPHLQGCQGGGCRRCEGHGWYVAVACCKMAEACGCPMHYGRLTSAELFGRAAEIVAAEQEVLLEQRIAWRDKESKLFGVVSRLIDADKRDTPEWAHALAEWEAHKATLEEALSLPKDG